MNTGMDGDLSEDFPQGTPLEPSTGVVAGGDALETRADAGFYA